MILSRHRGAGQGQQARCPRRVLRDDMALYGAMAAVMTSGGRIAMGERLLAPAAAPDRAVGGRTSSKILTGTTAPG
jgi:hypothetical protein